MRHYLSLSKTNLECAAEEGGGRTNTGAGTIVCGPNGEPLQPLYVPTKGELSNGIHAYIPVEAGCYIIRGHHHREDFDIEVLRITGVQKQYVNAAEAPPEAPFHRSIVEGKGYITWAEVVEVNHFSNGEWDDTLNPQLAAPVEALMNKITCYHCREPYYINPVKKATPLDDVLHFPQLGGGAE